MIACVRIMLLFWAASQVAAAQQVARIVPGGDLSVAMGRALERLPAGGVIQLEAGEFVVASPLNPRGVDRITVQGRGAGTVIRFHPEYFDPDDRWIINLEEKHDHWTFRDFVFDGNNKHSPPVCGRDKIIKLRGDHCTIERLTVRNEAGRGFATILGDDQRWLNCHFQNIGTHAGDSSIVHPGNRNQHAHRVLISGCTATLGAAKVTFVDAVASDLIVTGNIVRGGKTAVILSWWKGRAEHAVINGNILLSRGRACRLNRQRSDGEFAFVVVTNNVMTGPLQNQFGSGFVASGNSLKPPARTPPQRKREAR